MGCNLFLGDDGESSERNDKCQDDGNTGARLSFFLVDSNVCHDCNVALHLSDADESRMFSGCATHRYGSYGFRWMTYCSLLHFGSFLDAAQLIIMQKTRVQGRKTRSNGRDPYVANLLENIVEGKELLTLRKGETIFTQGSPADAIYFIQTGKVKVTVVSVQGREAVLAMLGSRDFLGEGCLVGQSLRISSATTLEAATLFRIEKLSMLRALHAQADLSEKFVASLLARNIDLEEDLCDQLFNHSEKRLARVLLKMARFGQRAACPGCQDAPIEP